MNTTNYIRIFRGDDSDALGYQTIVGTIKTDLDLTGCKAVFRFLGFYAEFDPIPEDKKLTIVIPAQTSSGLPPGVGYASLKVFDSLGKIRTFTNRIPVIVDTMTPSCGCGEFEVSFSPFPELEPLKIFIGPNADDFDQYTGFISKIIDRANLVKYGLAILADAMSEDGGASGKAASPLAVKAAYDAIIKELTDNYYSADQTEEAIDRVAAYYITRNAAGDAFETKAQLDSATVFYSGGAVRVPTRNDYAVVSADETHGGAEWRYIYAVADGQTTGQWEAQYPVEGVIAYDNAVTRTSANGVKSSGIWSAIWGALSALPTGFTSLYDWCVAQLAGKVSKSGDTMTGTLKTPSLTVGTRATGSSIGSGSVAEGSGTVASGAFAHAEGLNTEATARSSHAEGVTSRATGSQSHAEGFHTSATNPTEHAEGAYNASHTSENESSATLHSIGIGTADDNRKNAVETMKDGKTFVYGLGGYDGTNPTATGVKDLATAVNGKADVSAIPYSLVTKTISNNAVTLDDRAANAVTISATLSPNTLTINFPTATSGKVRDFAMRLNIAAGVTAPEIAWPQGVTLENDGGEVPEIADGGTGGSSTILYFSETENNGTTAKFLVKGETLTAIAQA